MKHNLSIHELTLAVAINNYDLTLCLPRFLQSSGIVHADWTLASEPVANNQVVQTIYSNGVNVIGQPHRCLFAENLENKLPGGSEVTQVATSYIKSLPHLDYQAIGMNLRGYIKLGTDADKAREQFYKKIFVPGAWQKKGNKQMEAELRLNYSFEDKTLNLVINNGFFNPPEGEPEAIILFGGNFAYNLTQYSGEERIVKLQEIIGKWQEDLKLFQEVIGDFPEVEVKQKKELATV